MTDISVVIPTVNREKILRRVIEGLIKQTYPADRFEVVVVDDNSTDGTQDTVKELRQIHNNIRYIKQLPGKKGPAAANNLGIRNATGDFILFINDDVIPDMHMLEEHMKYHNKYQNITVQGKVINTSSLDELDKRHDGYSGGYSKLSFGYFTTWNCSIRKELLIKAGMFDEDFINLCWEDVELGLRLRKLGTRQKYNGKAFGYHYRSEFSMKQLARVREKSINMGKNAMIYYKKHPNLEVKISTQSFWLPCTLHGIIKFAIYIAGKERLVDWLNSLEKKGRKRLLGFFIDLSGWYWYITGVKAAKAAL